MKAKNIAQVVTSCVKFCNLTKSCIYALTKIVRHTDKKRNNLLNFIIYICRAFITSKHK